MNKKLNKLVNSLNTAERRFISEHLITRKKENKLSTLFKLLILGEEHKANNTNAYYVRRKLLKDEVFKQLRLYHTNTSHKHKIRNKIFDIEILYEKGLNSYCLELINQSLKTCEKNEYFELILSLLELECLILQSNQKLDKLKEEVNINFQRTQEVQNKLRNLYFYLHRYYDFYFIWKQAGKIRTKGEIIKINSIFNIDNGEEVQEPLSYRAKKYFYIANTFYYFIINDINKGYESAKYHLKTLKDFKKQSGIEDEDAIFSALINIISCEVELKKYEKAIKSLKEIRAIKFYSNKTAAESISYSYLFEIEIGLKTGNFSKFEYFNWEIRQVLTKYNHYITEEIKLLLQFQMAYLCFGAEKLKPALEWINEIINEKNKSIREDIYSFALILNLIIHYELGNFIVIESLALSIYRYLYKKKRNYKIENIFLKYIRNQLLNHTDSKNLKKSLEELKILIDQLPEKDKEVALDNFDFISWLESKIQNRSFAEIVKEKFNENTA